LLRPELFDKNNRKAEAIKRLEEIISKRPDNYFAWEKLLLLCYENKDFNKLMIYGKECASRFNLSLLAKILYANGALVNEHYDVALEELRKAAILAGDDKNALLQVYVMKADVFYRINNLAEAFQTFEEALKLDPDDIIILNNYAYYLAEHDMELKKAEVMSRKVVEQEKDNATFLDTYAWVMFKQGKTKKAAKIMEQVISWGSDLSAEHYEHYGFILKKLRKCNEAVANWEIAMKLDNTKSQLNNEIENCRKR
jgi:tetratricopeptide (TPR) repeat protein